MTYVERQRKKRVETGQENEEGSDEIVDGSSASVGSHRQRNDVDQSSKRPANILSNAKRDHRQTRDVPSFQFIVPSYVLRIQVQLHRYT